MTRKPSFPRSAARSFISQMVPDITQVKDYGVPAEPADQLFAKSYGRSLMVGYCEQYKPDFVLMGLPNTAFLDHLESDLKDSLQVGCEFEVDVGRSIGKTGFNS